MNRPAKPSIPLLITVITVCLSISCSQKEQKEEQISIESHSASQTPDSNLNSVQGNISFNLIASSPNSVVLTGLPDHRLVTIYKTKKGDNSARQYSGFSYSSMNLDEETESTPHHIMPGFEILYGFNLINVAQFDIKNQKLNLFFKNPVLIKTLYYPSFKQDSIEKKPVVRDFYLVSVYDEDTNKDTLINKKDLRHFYYYDAGCNQKIQLIPPAYSVIRAQYDSANDIMYVFAILDENKNGTCEKQEPVHIFLIDLKKPLEAKRMY